jgi:tRNA pseudouridine38-40 synthase
MYQEKFYYLVHLQFLGFRFHGWQKQVGVKTVQYMLEQTLNTVIGKETFKTLGASRTDSMVSAEHHLCVVTAHNQQVPEELVNALNMNLPQDLKVLKIETVDKKFQIINSRKTKEYHYSFSYGEKTHPFCSPFLTNILDDLDLELMKEGAKLFVGEHNFIQYCFRGNPDKTFIRTINSSCIEVNDFLTGSFFPEKTYRINIVGEGFLRNQIRIIAGTLFNLGLGKITLADIEKSLSPENTETYPIGFIAPASGLILHKYEFIKE